jgi:predicted transposase/invertase (TIGR01784 family)
MPNFKKDENALTNRLDQWMYFLKHLEDFQHIPVIFKDKVFASAFQTAEIAKFNQMEIESYENSLKVYRDLKGVIDTARNEGKMEGKIEVAKTAKSMGMKTSDIIKLTELSKDKLKDYNFTRLSEGTVNRMTLS